MLLKKIRSSCNPKSWFCKSMTTQLFITFLRLTKNDLVWFGTKFKGIKKIFIFYGFKHATRKVWYKWLDQIKLITLMFFFPYINHHNPPLPFHFQYNYLFSRMAFSFINILFLWLLVTPLNFSLAKKCFFTKKYEVHVINKLPPNSPPLQVHCASKDQELGNIILPIDEDFNWSFCEKTFTDILYFCHFWWDSKDRSFAVYDDPIYCVHHGPNLNILQYCKWEVREDGFYLEQYDASNETYYMYRINMWY